jgi:hypothetical protein
MGESKIDIRIAAPFALEDLQAEIEHAGGKTIVPLVNGRFAGTVPGKPIKLRLLENQRADAPEPPQPQDVAAPDDPPSGDPVETHQLFNQSDDAGVPIPASGELRVQIVWGTPCHQPVKLPEGRRFGSYEHQLCAKTVGRDDSGAVVVPELSTEPKDRDTTGLPVGAHKLHFGDIIALAGDYYAYPDAKAAEDLAWAWPELRAITGWLSGRDYRTPPLRDAEASEPKDILGIIDLDKDSNHGVFGEFCLLTKDSIKGEYPARRYLALASQNFCHFGSQPPDGKPDDERNTALKLYRAYHERALDEAREAKKAKDRKALLRAFVVDAFGCHFLTDLFASGHMRVPRRELGSKYGILLGALHKAHAMHAEDNQLGLWVAARGTLDQPQRTIWRAYGDGLLRTDPAMVHREKVTEAVRRSAAEVYAAWEGHEVKADKRAEWLIPFPLRAGTTPADADKVEGNLERLKEPNHYPMYWLLPNGKMATRVGGPVEPTYTYWAGLLDGEKELQFGDPLP